MHIRYHQQYHMFISHVISHVCMAISQVISHVISYVFSTFNSHCAPLPSLASRRRFAVAAPFFLDSSSLLRLFSSASSTVSCRGNERPYFHIHMLTSNSLLPVHYLFLNLLLLSQIHSPQAIRNCWMCISFHVAWNEWHPSQHIFDRAYVQSR